MRKKLGCGLIPLLLCLVPMAAYGQLEPVLGTTLLLVDSNDTALGEALINAETDGGAGVPFSTSQGVGLIYFRLLDVYPLVSVAYSPKREELGFSDAGCKGTPYAIDVSGMPVETRLLVAGDAVASVYADTGTTVTVELESILDRDGTCYAQSSLWVAFPVLKVGELNTEFTPPFFLKPVQHPGLGPPPGRPGQRGRPHR